MGRILTFLTWMLVIFPQVVRASDWLERLDSAIDVRPSVKAEKEKKLADLRRTYDRASNETEKLKLLEQIGNEYLTYRYDSAMAYAERERRLAIKLSADDYSVRAVIRQALLNAYGGNYTEAEISLNAIPVDKLSPSLRYSFYLTRFWLYLYWGEYNNLREPYRKNMEESLEEAVKYAPQGTAEHFYLMGEKEKIVNNDVEKASRHYLQVVARTPVRSKLYASAAYSLAEYYRSKGKEDAFEDWAAQAAIADMLTPLKENFALQELAVHLFEKRKSDLKRATRYIYASMEDAQFYGNRLRMLEISRKFPDILAAYMLNIQGQKKRILYALVGLVLLSGLLFGASLFIKRQNRQLQRYRLKLQTKNTELKQQYKEVKQQKEKLEQLNDELNTLNEVLKITNDKLSVSNEKLHDTNKKRERLAKIYIDLCARYIGKLKQFQTLVKRKIKANQTSELLNMVFSSRIPGEDAETFLSRFDKAFLELYPTFVAEFNTLMLPESQFVLKQPGVLITELRIYALVRLGVSDSTEIADLLFCSPQTIYNYRSGMKSKAICRETLDSDVQRLCTTIQS